MIIFVADSSAQATRTFCAGTLARAKNNPLVVWGQTWARLARGQYVRCPRTAAVCVGAFSGAVYRADSEPAAPRGNRTECSPGRFELDPGGPGAPFGRNLAQFSAASLILKKSAPSAQPCAGAAGTTTRAGAWKHVPFAQPGRHRGSIRQGTPPVGPLAGFGGDFAKFEFSPPPAPTEGPQKWPCGGGKHFFEFCDLQTLRPH